MLSVLLGAAGLAAVLCLWFPSVLTTPELREIYDMTLIRGLIKAGLLAAFLCGAASLLLKRRKALGLTGIGLAGLAALMGGSQVEVSTPVRASDHLGLDWFLLPGHLDPREREFPLRSSAVGARHAAVPPLAPQRRVRSGGQVSPCTCP